MTARDALTAARQLRDLNIAARKLLQAAGHLLDDKPQLAFGELSDARALTGLVITEVSNQCGERGFDVGQGQWKFKRGRKS